MKLGEYLEKNKPNKFCILDCECKQLTNDVCDMHTKLPKKLLEREFMDADKDNEVVEIWVM